MKFTCNTKELSKACQIVSKAAATKAAIPALEGIKIEAKDGKISLCGFNLELGITTAIAAENVSEDGSTLIDAKMLCSMAKKLPDTFTTIETGDKGVSTISSGESKFEVVGIPAKEFPGLPQIDEKNEITIIQPTLKSMIGQTIYAVAQSDAKPIHTGVLFEVSSGNLNMVGVDGYRLGICKESIDYSGADFNFVVPGKTLSEVSRLLGNKPDDNVTISVDLRHAAFQIGDYSVFTRLLEGEFLDWKSTIPKECTTTLRVDTTEFLQAVQCASLVIPSTVRSPLITEFNSAESRITISSNTAIGKASDSIPAQISGKDVKIGFNHKFLTDAFSHAGCDEVCLQLNGPLSPMVILPDDGDSFVFLVLPVRLEAET